MTGGWKGQMLRNVPAPMAQTIRRHFYLRVVRRYRESDWPYAPWVRRWIRPGDAVVDAGANVGYLSALLAAMVGPDGAVHAFEPVPETADCLRFSMDRLGLSQVRVSGVALSDHDGAARMSVPQYDHGGENYYESSLERPDPLAKVRELEVTTRTLDAWWKASEESRRLSFIKIDVEGHEFSVIQGAVRLLEAHQPPLLIEVNENPSRPGTSAAALFEALGARAYRPWILQEGHLRPYVPGDRAVDYLFVTEAHAAALRATGPAPGDDDP